MKKILTIVTLSIIAISNANAFTIQEIHASKDILTDKNAKSYLSCVKKGEKAGATDESINGYCGAIFESKNK